MKKVYIRSASCISPQNTFGDVPFLPETVVYETARLKVIEPDYKQFIDPKQSRRMSRVIRIGVAAAMDCLQRVGVKEPDAIITGTAYGCVEDTGNFLTRLIEMDEEMLSPTAFIQSTHNTVAAQVALMLQCHAYNNTFVHKSFSFESALLDTMMFMGENPDTQVLLGGIDEITDTSFAIFNRFDIFKKGAIKNTELYSDHTTGTISGEGAAFFLLSNEPSDDQLACIEAFATFFKPKDIEQEILSFFKANNLKLEDIDLVITGRNGDERTDAPFDLLDQSIFKKNKVLNYKHLCGEYPVATSFALWLAANMVKTGSVPAALGGAAHLQPKRILICNNYQNKYWSLMVVAAC